MAKEKSIADTIKCPPGSEMIILEVGPDLKPKITVKGVMGDRCKSLTADIEKALGKKISDTPTHEMNINVQQTNRAKQNENQ